MLDCLANAIRDYNYTTEIQVKTTTDLSLVKS